MKFTFFRKDDDLYYMRVKWAKLANGNSLVMEVNKENKDDEKEEKSNEIEKNEHERVT